MAHQFESRLLSFGDEAEEEQEEINQVVEEKFRGKPKSSHDLLKNDPKLSSQPAVETDLITSDHKKERKDDGKDSKRVRTEEEEARLNDVKKRLKKFAGKETDKSAASKSAEPIDDQEEDEDDLDPEAKEKKRKLEEIKKEYREIKRQMIEDKKRENDQPDEKPQSKSEAVAEFEKEIEKYKQSASTSKLKKGSSREEQALAMLAKFQERLHSSKQKKTKEEEEEEATADPDSWLVHKLRSDPEDKAPVLAKDAAKRGEGDWYDLYDPRNPLNVRRREASSKVSKKKSNDS